ncbi:MAG: FxLYD domain-containing protein, partial [Nitrososphaeraceae archaeon]
MVDRVFAENEFYSIENTLKYQDESGYLYVLGEISNVSEESLTNVTLTADFYDIDGKLLGEYYRSPEIGVINPAERSPFKIIYLEQPTADKVFNYTIRVDYEVGNIKPDELVIESLNSRFDISGFYYINGQITNNGIENANNVTVVGTFYDKNGNVIGITEAITEPFSIP